MWLRGGGWGNVETPLGSHLRAVIDFSSSHHKTNSVIINTSSRSRPTHVSDKLSGSQFTGEGAGNRNSPQRGMVWHGMACSDC